MRSLVLPSKSSALVVVALAFVIPACGESKSGEDDEPAGESGAGGVGSGGKAGATSGGASGKAGSAGASGRGGAAGKGGTGGGSGSAGKAGSAGSDNQAGDGAGGDSGGSGGMDSAGGASESGGAGGEPEVGGFGTGGAKSGTTCQSILDKSPGNPTGIYMVDPDGEGGEEAVPVMCDMETEGGGWTLGLVKNSVDNASYAAFATGRVNLNALNIPPETASATNIGIQALAGWFDLNEFPYSELEIVGYRAGAEVYRSLPIPKSALRIPFGQNGYYLYDQVDHYYWCGGANSYTTDGVGQVNAPSGAPADCKGHTSLGDGWDFGTAEANAGLTVCGGGSLLMSASPGGGFVNYPSQGAAQAFWVR